MNKQIYQQTRLNGAISTDNTFFVIDMLDPVSKTYKTYSITSAQLGAFVKSLESGCCTLTTKTSLTSAQILNLYSTPQIIVPSAGAGTYIQPLGIDFSLTYGTTAYATHTQLYAYNNGNGNPSLAFASNNSILIVTQSSVASNYVNGGGFALPVPLSAMENQPLMLTVATGNPTAGDSILDIYVTYKVVTA